ncbi:MAG: hypothetical protein KatS3mg031_2955 [Chitinophagales bacterium]|nr:MAG: hypothetical protein KatS3mg031_2955 [Chitinophagales bacterium]
MVVINGYNFQTRELNNIAVNDGFENWEEMKEFFKKDFFGKVIFWDNCKFNS